MSGLLKFEAALNRPQVPEILVGLRERPCSLAIFMETGWNSPKVEQQKAARRRPIPQHFGFIPHPDLPQLNPGAEHQARSFDQFPEIHPAIRCKVKTGFCCCQGVFPTSTSFISSLCSWIFFWQTSAACFSFWRLRSTWSDRPWLPPDLFQGFYNLVFLHFPVARSHPAVIHTPGCFHGLHGPPWRSCCHWGQKNTLPTFLKRTPITTTTFPSPLGVWLPISIHPPVGQLETSGRILSSFSGALGPACHKVIPCGRAALSFPQNVLKRALN